MSLAAILKPILRGRCGIGLLKRILSSPTGRNFSIGRSIALTPAFALTVATNRNSPCICRVAAATCGSALRRRGGVNWLNEARQIVTRYRPGSLLYEIRDPLLGEGKLLLSVLPTACSEGFVARVELRGASAADLIWAFGGANGARGARLIEEVRSLGGRGKIIHSENLRVERLN